MNDAIVTGPDVVSPFGSYSAGRRIGALVAVSGQVGIDPATKSLSGPDAYSQTTQALRNVFAVLQQAGVEPADLLSLSVHLARAEDFPEMDRAFAALLPPPFPARTTVFGGLLEGILVEIDGLAVTGAPATPTALPGGRP